MNGIQRKSMQIMVVLGCAAGSFAGEPSGFSFDSEGKTENWYASAGVGGFSVSSGSLNYELTDKEQFVRTQDLSGRKIDCGSVRKIKIRLKNQTSGRTGQIYFITSETTTWENVRFPIQKLDGEYQEYIVDLGKNRTWSGTLKYLRFDIPDATGQVSIDSIELLTEEDSSGCVMG